MNHPFFLLVLALVLQAAAAQAPLSFNLTSVTNSLNKFSHPLKQSEDLYFVVEIDIGLPPARTFLAVDTVLPLSWVAGQFDATKSSTFTPMRAMDPLCLPPLARNSSSNKCTYDVVLSRGQFGLDIFMNFLSSKSVPFGAGKFVDDAVGTVDGVLGLGVGHPLNFLQQLKPLTLERFSYCLPYDLKLEQVADRRRRRYTATLDFGEAARFRKAASRRVQTTAILRAPEGEGEGLDYYFLNLTTISVADIPLPIDQEIFSPSRGGFFIHSATPYSLFVDEAYRKIHQAIVDLYSDKFGLHPLDPQQSRSGFDLCYQLHAAAAPAPAPTMKLHFEGGEKILELQPDTLFQAFPELNEYCLMILPVQVGQPQLPNTLGALQQIGHRFLFDVAASTVSFAPEKCYSDPQT